jgi:hypothetical protein
MSSAKKSAFHHPFLDIAIPLLQLVVFVLADKSLE